MTSRKPGSRHVSCYLQAEASHRPGALGRIEAMTASKSADPATTRTALAKAVGNRYDILDKVGAGAIAEVYVAPFANYGMTYGTLESVVIFAIWINLSAALLLWGGELAALLAGARGKEQAQEA